MAEVILKGEHHHSDADFEEEKELIKNKPDALLIEGNENSNNKVNLGNYWFILSTKIAFWIIGRLQTSHNILLELADVQDIEIRYTRENNGELLENSPYIISFIAGLGSIIFLLLSIYSGLGYINVFGTTKSILAFVSALGFPLVVLRGYNTFISNNDLNRDKLIVQKIHNLADDGYDKILVILGDKHLKGVQENLRDNLQVNLIPPKYNWYSLENLKGILVPVFEICLISYSFYILTITFFEYFIHYFKLILSL